MTNSQNSIETEYPDIYKLVEELLSLLQISLGDDLKGLYVFGSLVGGGFDDMKSDIDLLAMVENVISEAQLEKLKEAHTQFVLKHPEWANRVEVAYVSVDGMRHFKTKTNRIARISPGEELHFRDMDIDWLIDWHMVQDQGQTVFGPPPETYIPHITTEEFVDSIRGIMRQHAETVGSELHKGYQSYIVMSFCRNLYAVQHGKQISKTGGAEWAAKQYPEWAAFINMAASWRGMKDKSASPETLEETTKFVEFAMKESEKS